VVAVKASIRRQVVTLRKANCRGREGQIVAGTKGGTDRVTELDLRTVSTLRAWRKEQADERLLMGEGYDDHGLALPRPHPDGRPYHPEAFSKTFDR
jgi:hypothetical protein